MAQSLKNRYDIAVRRAFNELHAAPKLGRVIWSQGQRIETQAETSCYRVCGKVMQLAACACLNVIRS